MNGENTQKENPGVLRHGNKPHRLTRADRVKAGKTKTPLNIIVDDLRFRKYCNPTCKIWEKCWSKKVFKTVITPNTDPRIVEKIKQLKDEKTGKNLCALKTYENEIQISTIKLALHDERGILDLMSELSLRLYMNTSFADNKEILETLRGLALVNNTLFGAKHRTEVKGELDLKTTFIQALHDSIEKREEEEANAAEEEKRKQTPGTEEGTKQEGQPGKTSQ